MALLYTVWAAFMLILFVAVVGVDANKTPLVHITQQNVIVFTMSSLLQCLQYFLCVAIFIFASSNRIVGISHNNCFYLVFM